MAGPMEEGGRGIREHTHPPSSRNGLLQLVVGGREAFDPYKAPGGQWNPQRHS